MAYSSVFQLSIQARRHVIDNICLDNIGVKMCKSESFHANYIRRPSNSTHNSLHAHCTQICLRRYTVPTQYVYFQHGTYKK